jgi:ectoine hydroxylase-related dioxygenase (phytanoyl-CoA dioxygenase family)
LSAVLFVDVEKTDARFFFHANHNLVLIKKQDVISNFSNLKEVQAKDGTVIFFDGSVKHSVSPNNTNNTRVTMAVNYKVNYKQERDEY